MSTLLLFQLSRPTIRAYVTLLARVFLLDALPPWHSNRLSRLIKTPKLHLGDTGLACALLGLDGPALVADRPLLGPLLETFVFQELRRQADRGTATPPVGAAAGFAWFWNFCMKVLEFAARLSSDPHRHCGHEYRALPHSLHRRRSPAPTPSKSHAGAMMNLVARRLPWLLVLLPLVLIPLVRPASAAPVAGAAARARDPAAVAAPAPAPVAAPARPSLPNPPGGGKPSREQVSAMIDEVAKQYGVERQLVRAVVGAESNFNAHAVSRVGAVGLMQVMPATAGDYGVTSTAALFDPKTNLRTGTRHLKRLLDKYKGDYGRVIMAYNAGEGVVDRYGRNVTYQETLDYTEAVISNYRRNGGAVSTEGALTKVHVLRGMRNRGQARRLLKKYLDPSLLSLKVKPTLALHSLSPALHAIGPQSRPMFELDLQAMR